MSASFFIYMTNKRCMKPKGGPMVYNFANPFFIRTGSFLSRVLILFVFLSVLHHPN